MKILWLFFQIITPYHNIIFLLKAFTFAFQDIERMKSSASAIAEALNEFAKTLRETELPNDADTTARILQTQTCERIAIKVRGYVFF